jgi:hypothetical protein
VVREDSASVTVGCLLCSGTVRRGGNGQCASRLNAKISAASLSLFVSMAVDGSMGSVDCSVHMGFGSFGLSQVAPKSTQTCAMTYGHRG